MNFDDFMGQVQQRARLSDTGRAVRATLTALGKRLDPGERSNLAAQLPSEVGEYLRQIDGQETYDLKEFYRRVGEEEGADLPDASHHARMVMSVVRDAVSAGEVDDVFAQLPDDYDELKRSSG